MYLSESKNFRQSIVATPGEDSWDGGSVRSTEIHALDAFNVVGQ